MSDPYSPSFDKMVARLEVWPELEKMGDVNNPAVLRKFLQRQSYLLASTLYEKKRCDDNLKQKDSYQKHLKNQNEELQKQYDHVQTTL